MAHNSDQYDFFVSYARYDNVGGWITRFVEQIQEEHRKYSGGREFRVFFDKTEIRSLDDWRHRIYESVAASRLLVAFISPSYFASEWCRREWHMWIDVEIAKHVLSDGAAPIYIVEVPWLNKTMSEQQVTEEIGKLPRHPADRFLARDAIAVAGEVSHRQLTMVRQFYDAGLDALRQQDLLRVLAELAKNLSARSEHVDAAARSRSTIPPYNRRFVGRLEELATLRERLHQGRTGVISGHKGNLPEDKSTIAGVHGLGGIGKTELAFTYAHAFAGLYPGGRLLVPCDGRPDLRQAMLALDEVFRDQISDEQRKTVELHFGAIRDCLRQRLHELGPILLVLDNVSELRMLNPEQTDLVRTLGPELHLLATTRLGAPEGAAFDEIHWLTLGELSLEDSLRLLEKYRLFSTPEEQTAAERIARRLGGFALCVEVVGAYLGQHLEQSFAEYLELMGLTDLEHVDETAERAEVSTRRHNNEKRLGAILAPTLSSLPAEAVTALEFAALLPPDYIVLPWLCSLIAGEYSELASDAEAWQRVVARLESLALLMRRQDGDHQTPDESTLARILRCHRLVQGFMRGRITVSKEDAHQKSVNALVIERDAVLKKTTQWHGARWELEPLDALAALWDDTSHPRATWLLKQVARRWYDLADWSRAEPLLRRALAVDEKGFGPEHPTVASSLNNLAALLQATNRLAEAEPLYRRALAIVEKSLGLEASDVATQLNNLAWFLSATNRLAEAEPLYRRALIIHEKSLGPEHPNVAACLGNLGQLLQDTNRLVEAEPLIRRSLAIAEQNLGPEHPDVATALNNLALLLQETNRTAEAEPLMRRALAVDEKGFGPEHPNVAIRLSNLAALLQDTDRPAEAEPLYRRALAIDEKSLGPDHTNVAVRLNNLGALLRHSNRMAEAEPFIRRALAIDERSLGTEHPKVARDLSNLAGLLKATSRMAEAEPLLRRALVIKENSFGPEHPDVARGLNNLAELLQDANRLMEAEPLYRRALIIYEKSLGPEHHDVASNLGRLAKLLQATNRLAEAEALLRRALVIDEKSLGFEHPEVADCLTGLALLLKNTDRLTDAEPLYRRALAIDEKNFEADHPNVARDLNNLAVLLRVKNRLAEAEPMMRRALAIDEKNFGPEHPAVARDSNNLAQVLKATGRLADAEPLYRRALAVAEKSFGPEHTDTASYITNLARLLRETDRLSEAEPLIRRQVEIFLKFTIATGQEHPHTRDAINNYQGLLRQMGRSPEQIQAQVNTIARPFGVQFGGGN